MTQETKLKLSIGTAVSIITMISIGIASFYGSKAESKAYTDAQVQSVSDESRSRDIQVFKDISDMKVMIARIDQILIERFGHPKP
jgi:hypothetical protein